MGGALSLPTVFLPTMEGRFSYRQQHPRNRGYFPLHIERSGTTHRDCRDRQYFRLHIERSGREITLVTLSIEGIFTGNGGHCRDRQYFYRLWRGH